MWERAGDGQGDTWTAENPLPDTTKAPAGRIDYVFVSPEPEPEPDMVVVAVRRIGTAPVDGVWLSDHHGVRADVEVRPRGGAA